MVSYDSFLCSLFCLYHVTALFAATVGLGYFYYRRVLDPLLRSVLVEPDMVADLLCKVHLDFDLDGFLNLRYLGKKGKSQNTSVGGMALRRLSQHEGSLVGALGPGLETIKEESGEEGLPLGSSSGKGSAHGMQFSKPSAYA